MNQLIKNLVVNRQFLFGKKEYIFIISHIRSNSSLLSHILGSNEEIAGHCEMHQSYSGIRDLMKLRYKISLLQNENISDERYVLDKMLSNHNRISRDILSMENIHWIFLLRQPEDTFKSIVNMGRKLVDKEWYREPEKILAYYEARLHMMERFVHRIRGKSLFLESETLIKETDHTLGYLSDWLELHTPLNSEYSIFSDTGLPWYGDPSKTIKSGRIVRDKKSYEDIIIQEDILNKAQEVYHHATNMISSKADTSLRLTEAVLF